MQFKKEKISQVIILIILISSLAYALKKDRWSVYELTQVFKEDEGTRALPTEVLRMKKIISRTPISDYKLEGYLNSNTLIYQRSVEYLYPVRINSESNFVFAKENQSSPGNCQLIDKENEIELYRCEK